MHDLSPADELAEIRAELARLRLRQAALRAQILRNPADHALGRWNRVEVVEHRLSRFTPALLPDSIRQDPRYQAEHLVQSLHCRPVTQSVTLRPGWPIRRDWAQMH
jgi:hypothetical protein